MKTSCGKCGSGGGVGGGPGAFAGPCDGQDADESELVLLRSRLSEMKEEQTEFKCLMKEQSYQLEEYRKKYMDAQQRVEEQNGIIEKLNMNNKRIEKQINMEVKEIRMKFQEKLNELLQFPKLLENEHIKLTQVVKEKENLENKLIVVCRELKNYKNKEGQSNGVEDCRPQLERCQAELTKAKAKVEEFQKQREMLCEQLKTTQEDLDTLRSESAKIIARTKERAENLRQQQQQQIDRLEKDLAQCRATACLSINDREVVIREMQGQLNTLSFSFDSAQKQIKTLRNHIAYMSNENCFPTKG